MIKSMLALFVYIFITISIMLHQKSMTNITRSMFNMTPPVNAFCFQRDSSTTQGSGELARPRSCAVKDESQNN